MQKEGASPCGVAVWSRSSSSSLLSLGQLRLECGNFVLEGCDFCVSRGLPADHRLSYCCTENLIQLGGGLFLPCAEEDLVAILHRRPPHKVCAPGLVFGYTLHVHADDACTLFGARRLVRMIGLDPKESAQLVVQVPALRAQVRTLCPQDRASRSPAGIMLRACASRRDLRQHHAPAGVLGLVDGKVGREVLEEVLDLVLLVARTQSDAHSTARR